MKIYKFLLASIFVPSICLASTKPFSCISDIKDGSSELKKLQDRYASVQSMSARFEQRSYLAALDTSELSGGTLLFRKPGMMRWSYRVPEAQEFISDGKTLWYYQPTDEQVLVDNFKSSFQSDLPVSFLLGIGNLSKDFKLRRACKSDGGVLLELLPKNSGEEELQHISILVSSTDSLPIGAELFDSAGNKNSFLFSEISTNGVIGEGSFKPTFPKGTDVIDNRRNARSE